jgi:hypothetical protein
MNVVKVCPASGASVMAADDDIEGSQTRDLENFEDAKKTAAWC